MHAASLSAAETPFATAAAAASAARAAGAKEAAAADTTTDIATNAAQAHRRVETVEMNTRNARRAEEVETRATDDTEKSGPQENIAGASETAATLLKRAEGAERAFEEQKRQQAVRMVSTRHMY